MSRKILEKVLRWCTRRILKKYKPAVIGVAGSVGKTTTREAIAAVLSQQFSVRQSIRSYNDGIGVPMTIIGLESPGKSVAGWVTVFFYVARLLLTRMSYPKKLIVEMGTDRPGDIAYLTEMCPPDVAVLTAISPEHYEYFKSMERLEDEEKTIVRALRPGGVAVLNGDDARVMGESATIPGPVMTFGFGDHVDMRVAHAAMVRDEHRVQGMEFGLTLGQRSLQARVEGVIGTQHGYALAAAAAVGVHFGMEDADIEKGLSLYRAAPGRMRLIEGVKHTTIIDDTYNASPRAAQVAVETLAKTPVGSERGERYAVLGDMLELGSITREEHEDLGRIVVDNKIDFLITVGPASKHSAAAALDEGMEEHRIAKFDTSVAAGAFLQEKLEVGDVVLVKGSQGVRMEKIVREIMARPEDAPTLIARTYGKWLED